MRQPALTRDAVARHARAAFRLAEPSAEIGAISSLLTDSRITCNKIITHERRRVIEPWSRSGDDLLQALAALANPHRLRILAALVGGRNYVSQLARELGISRPLLHMHLRRLEAAGLVTGKLELSDEGKAMKYFEVTEFTIVLTPERIAEAVRTLNNAGEEPPGGNQEETRG